MRTLILFAAVTVMLSVAAANGETIVQWSTADGGNNHYYGLVGDHTDPNQIWSWEDSKAMAESLTYFPVRPEFKVGPEAYLEHLRRAKAAVGVPVIASLNGVSTGGWVRYARLMEEAGADALELNVYYMATDLDRTAPEIELMYLELARAVKTSVRIPVAIKLGHAFTAAAHFARRLDESGVDALVLFNRFYQPDFDLERLEVVPTLTLSHSSELLLRLHWVAVLYGRIRADLAITGGVHTAVDVLKAMMAGARVAMMTSALLEQGVGHLASVRADLLAWMDAHEYESIRQMQGSMSHRSVPDPSAFERANYLRVLGSYVLRAVPRA
jgi:dihydroorotate dehydrogenase (fumarate)